MINKEWSKITEEYRGYYITDNGSSYSVYDKDECYKATFSCIKDCKIEIYKFYGDFREKDRDYLKEFASIFVKDMKEVLSSNYKMEII